MLIKSGIRAERILTAVGSPRSLICGAAVKIWIVPGNSAKADEAGYYSQLLAEAESNEYTIRRVEFVGLQSIRDEVLRKQFVQQEGEVFSRNKLADSLNNFNRLRLVYPLTLADVEARLDRTEHMIDLTIYFRARPRRR